MIYFFIFISNVLVAQNLLNGPEDIVQDTLHNRYLVVNAMFSNIVQIDYDGNQTVFKYGVSVPLGLHIQDSLVYVTTNYPTAVKGYSLDDGSLKKSISILGATGLAGICDDDNGFLYVVDQAGKLYKIDLDSETVSLFADSGLPQGTQAICFDSDNQRLIIGSYPYNSSILAVNLSDSSVVTLTTTTIGRFIKIIQSSNGNYYISSWRTNSVYEFDQDFTNAPQVFSSNHNQPTGLCINEQEKCMYVLNFGDNSIDTVYFNPSNVHQKKNLITKEFELFQNYPNPFNPVTTISYSIPQNDFVVLEVFDSCGNKIKTLINGFQKHGDWTVVWDSTNYLGQKVTSGLYIYRLTLDGLNKSGKMLLIR